MAYMVQPRTFCLSTAQVVENVSFPDFDLDASDLGGVLAWSEPRDISQAANRASLEITMVRKSAVC